jgi:SPOR domain
MADLEYDDFDGGSRTVRGDGRLEKARRVVNLAGAACSVALILGLGLWGYRLAVRDVTGVPVMRAMAGAMRVAPADPGGDQASHQGLSVNAVAATGTALPLADQIVLAPRPVELQPGDLVALTPEAPTEALLLTDLTINGLTITGQALPASESASQEADPEGGSAIDDAVALALDLPEVEPLADVPEGALRVSLRPSPRPPALGGATAAEVSAVQSVAAPGPVAELDAATLEIGTRLAQLGAFDSPEAARERFEALRLAFGELFTGKAMVIQPAQSGGRSFYRLRAHGFEGDDEARRFCAALQSEDADCIPVAQR